MAIITILLLPILDAVKRLLDIITSYNYIKFYLNSVTARVWARFIFEGTTVIIYVSLSASCCNLSSATRFIYRALLTEATLLCVL